jgi:hypothetical protein
MLLAKVIKFIDNKVQDMKNPIILEVLIFCLIVLV